LVPEHAGFGLMTGPVTVAVVPQELLTVGGTGTVCALTIHGTVELPGAGAVMVGGEMI
jgi:hypothetical protein